jgi:hypothetical protein
MKFHLGLIFVILAAVLVADSPARAQSTLQTTFLSWFVHRFIISRHHFVPKATSLMTFTLGEVASGPN